MIGFFGGSFDPVHYGHLKNAVAIKQELGLSALFLMPCAAPVHKSELQFSTEQRLEMLNLLFKNLLIFQSTPEKLTSNHPLTRLIL